MDISTDDYQRFRQLLEQHSGILLGENKQYLVVSRLSNFLRENKIHSMADLLQQMTRSADRRLLHQVIDRMTTNETLWYRDRYPFEYLKSTILRERQGRRGLRIWCAACSSGQEPYSIAMLLDESARAESAEIVATDLSESMLAKARQGIYQKIELNRGLPNQQLSRFFAAKDDNNWQLNAQIRNRVRFQTLNLLKQPYTLGKFEVIFCRNVLIYFSNHNKTKVINALIESLHPGGYLFLGASESLPRDSKPLKMIRCNPGLVYRKE